MPCLLCQHTTKLYFDYGKYVGVAYALVRCSSCSLIQTEPMPTTEFLRAWYQRYDVLGEREPYYAALASENPWKTPEGLDIARQFARVKREIGIRNQKSGIKVLDVGSGHGLFLDLVKRAGWQGIGVELNERAAKRSRERFGVEARVGTIESVVFGHTLFDVITLWDIFEHVPDPMDMVRRARELLKSRGLLFIETPDASSFLDRSVIMLARFGFVGPASIFYGLHHLTLWNQKNIRHLLEKNGFKIVSVGGDYTPAGRIFRSASVRDHVMRFGVNVAQKIGQLIGRKNKMIIVAERL